MPAAMPSTSSTVTEIKPVITIPLVKKEVDIPTINFIPGSSIEAQNFDSKWISVKVVEVDMEEREVLVRFPDKSNKSKTG